MKKTLTSLLVAIIFLAGGFGTIAVLTRVSETIDESGTAASQAIQEQDEAEVTELEDAIAIEQAAQDCLPSELFDPETNECFYECDTEEQCAALEKKLDEEFEAIYENGFSVNLSEDAPDENFTATYTVRGNTITLETGNNEAAQQHKELWSLFASIAGTEFITSHVSKFNVYSSEESDTAAHVSQTEDNINKWQLAVNLSSFYEGATLNKAEAHYTMIHEFAHILSLNPTQVPPATLDELDGDAAATACPRFFTGEGCANKDSYIQAFYTNFWKDMSSDESEEDAATVRYEQNPKSFVTEYAATNPGEDFSEVFTAFVLKAKPKGASIADKKVQSLHEYPELVTLRNQIRTALR